jgi:hypothetical protein
MKRTHELTNSVTLLHLKWVFFINTISIVVEKFSQNSIFENIFIKIAQFIKTCKSGIKD